MGIRFGRLPSEFACQDPGAGRVGDPPLHDLSKMGAARAGCGPKGRIIVGQGARPPCHRAAGTVVSIAGQRRIYLALASHGRVAALAVEGGIQYLPSALSRRFGGTSPPATERSEEVL